MITTEIDSSAAPATIHELLVDVDSWSLWSPHVASVTAVTRRIAPGWTGATRAFFSPGATSMIVDDVRADGGYTWHTTLGPWRLDYDNHVAAADDRSTAALHRSVDRAGRQPHRATRRAAVGTWSAAPDGTTCPVG